jgi:hypothetical protein
MTSQNWLKMIRCNQDQEKGQRISQSESDDNRLHVPLCVRGCGLVWVGV